MVAFASGGPGETIAAVLAAHGIQTSVSCEQGMCGACLNRVLSGVPEHRDTVQSDEEKQRNELITICCSRGQGVLTLDL